MRAALNISLADIEAARSLKERPTNPDAFDLILRSRAIMLLPPTKDRMAQAVALLQQALAHDPNSVLALVGSVIALLNESYLEGISHDVAMDQAVQYLARAKTLDPNSEYVLLAQAWVLEFQGGPHYRQARSERKAVSQRLIDLYPNSPEGYFHLGFVERQEGEYDKAVDNFATVLRLSPRSSGIKTVYWEIAYCHITGGNDLEGLAWADRAIAAPGSLPQYREHVLLGRRAVAYFRTGDVEMAKRLVAELNDRFPFDAWRARAPNNPNSEMDRGRFRSKAAIRLFIRWPRQRGRASRAVR